MKISGQAKFAWRAKDDRKVKGTKKVAGEKLFFGYIKRNKKVKSKFIIHPNNIIRFNSSEIKNLS